MELCRICLAADRKMFVMDTKHQHIYENVTGITVLPIDKLPKYVCWECRHFMSKYFTFKRKAVITHSVLMEMSTIQNITITTLKEYQGKSTLTRSEILHLNLGGIYHEDIENMTEIHDKDVIQCKNEEDQWEEEKNNTIYDYSEINAESEDDDKKIALLNEEANENIENVSNDKIAKQNIENFEDMIKIEAVQECKNEKYSLWDEETNTLSYDNGEIFVESEDDDKTIALLNEEANENIENVSNDKIAKQNIENFEDMIKVEAVQECKNETDLLWDEETNTLSYDNEESVKNDSDMECTEVTAKKINNVENLDDLTESDTVYEAEITLLSSVSENIDEIHSKDTFSGNHSSSFNASDDESLLSVSVKKQVEKKGVRGKKKRSISRKKEEGPSIKEPKANAQREKNNSEVSNENSVVNSHEKSPTEIATVAELFEKTEHLEEIKIEANGFETAVGVKNNNLIETSKAKFVCNECGQQFHEKVSIILHNNMKTKHLKEVYVRCEKCSYYTTIKQSLEKHLKLHDESGQHVCQCGFRFKSKSTLKLHKEACNIKNNVSSANSTVVSHMRTHTGEKPYSCTVCNKQFSHSNTLIRHMRTHTGEKLYSCTVCNKQFSQICNLNTHMRTHTGEKPYSCTVCNKQFSHSNSLISHMRTHTGEKPYSCTVCNKQFSQSNTLIRHMRTHTGEKLYSCTVCNKQFSQIGNLNTHMRTHTDEKPYSCTVCSKQFSQIGHLNRHMRTHTGEKPYSCTVCNKQFTHSNTLISHMRTHTGEKPYSCTVCKKRFANRSTLRNHSRKCQ